MPDTDPALKGRQDMSIPNFGDWENASNLETEWSRTPWVVWQDGTLDWGRQGTHHAENWYGRDNKEGRSVGVVEDGKVYMYRGLPEDYRQVLKEMNTHMAGINYPGKPSDQVHAPHSSMTCQDPNCSICAWLKKPKTAAEETEPFPWDPNESKIQVGHTSPREDEVGDYSKRQPVKWMPEDQIIYVGQVSTHHEDLESEFNLGSYGLQFDGAIDLDDHTLMMFGGFPVDVEAILAYRLRQIDPALVSWRSENEWHSNEDEDWASRFAAWVEEGYTNKWGHKFKAGDEVSLFMAGDFQPGVIVEIRPYQDFGSHVSYDAIVELFYSQNDHINVRLDDLIPAQGDLGLDYLSKEAGWEPERSPRQMDLRSEVVTNSRGESFQVGDKAWTMQNDPMYPHGKWDPVTIKEFFGLLSSSVVLETGPHGKTITTAESLYKEPLNMVQAAWNTSVPVHEFDNSGTAYNRTQTDPSIKDGDVLVVPPEGVVGIMYKAWPTAVTEYTGEFHGLGDMGGALFETEANNWAQLEGGKYLQSYQTAVREIQRLGLKTARDDTTGRDWQEWLGDEAGGMPQPNEAPGSIPFTHYNGNTYFGEPDEFHWDIELPPERSANDVRVHGRITPEGGIYIWEGEDLPPAMIAEAREDAFNWIRGDGRTAAWEREDDKSQTAMGYDPNYDRSFFVLRDGTVLIEGLNTNYTSTKRPAHYDTMGEGVLKNGEPVLTAWSWLDSSYGGDQAAQLKAKYDVKMAIKRTLGDLLKTAGWDTQVATDEDGHIFHVGDRVTQVFENNEYTGTILEFVRDGTEATVEFDNGNYMSIDLNSLYSDEDDQGLLFSQRVAAWNFQPGDRVRQVNTAWTGTIQYEVTDLTPYQKSLDEPHYYIVWDKAPGTIGTETVTEASALMRADHSADQMRLGLKQASPISDYQWIPLTQFELSGWEDIPQRERYQWQRRADRHNSRARKMKVQGGITGRELWAVNKRFEGQCAYCGKYLAWGTPDATLDHVHALGLGGSGGIDNIVPSCYSCNQELAKWDQRNNPDMSKEDYYVPEEFGGPAEPAISLDPTVF